MRNRLLWISFLVLNIISYLGFFCSFANIKDISGLYHGVVSVLYILLWNLLENKTVGRKKAIFESLSTEII